MSVQGVILAVLLSCLLPACATELTAPEPASSPDGATALVVGRALLYRNGVVDPGRRQFGVEPQIIHHLDLFSGDDGITRNPFAVGNFAFRAITHDDGYFAVKLPPGRYYFVEYDYINLDHGTWGARSYMATNLGTEMLKRLVTTFEVLPGKATYIGSMRHLLDGTGTLVWGIRHSDESAKAKDWVDRNYPAWGPAFTTHLAETHVMGGEPAYPAQAAAAPPSQQEPTTTPP